MKTLLIELMNWFQQTGYRKASYDRLLSYLPSATDYNQLNDLVNNYEDYLRPAKLKGGYPGLALLEHVYPNRVLTEQGTPAPEPLTYAPPVPAPLLDPIEPVIDYTRPLTAPMVRPTTIEAEIQDEYYRNLGSALKTPDGPAANVTLCVLVLKNGFVIVGKSACVSRANFDEEIGKHLAREDAIKQLWPFMGFRLADTLTSEHG